jgi:hypothetical protein
MKAQLQIRSRKRTLLPIAATVLCALAPVAGAAHASTGPAVIRPPVMDAGSYRVVHRKRLVITGKILPTRFPLIVDSFRPEFVEVDLAPIVHAVRLRFDG